MTAEQLALEKRKEAEFNKLFEMVIQKSPFGQWYGLMIAASNLLTQNLPKRVAVDKDGRPFVQYKGFFSKVAGVWATPTHKVIAEDLSQKKYGKALGDLLGIGQILQMQKQTSKKTTVFDLSPNEVTILYKRKAATSSPEAAKLIAEAEKQDALKLQKLKINNVKTPFAFVLRY